MFLAFVLGIAAGLRVFTPPAAVLLARGGIWGYVFAILAVGEYVADSLPMAPARTMLPSLVLRMISGGFVGFMAGGTAGMGTVGAIVGIVGALIGSYGGLSARLWAIARFGPIPAALLEDVIAIGLAVFVVTRGIFA